MAEVSDNLAPDPAVEQECCSAEAVLGILLLIFFLGASAYLLSQVLFFGARALSALAG